MSSLINQQCLKYSLIKKESILSADTGTSDILWDEKCHWSHLMSQFGIEMKMSGQFVWHLKVCSVVFDLY